MPHSYAIAINLLQDYKQTPVVTLPIKYNIVTTKIYIILYILLFSIVNIALNIYGYTDNIYLYIMSIIDIIWLFMAIYGLFINNNIIKQWAKYMFIYSIIVIMIFSIAIIGTNR